MTLLQTLAQAEMSHHTLSARMNGYIGSYEPDVQAAVQAAPLDEIEWCDLETD